MIKWIEEDGIKWATDNKGNKCSVKFFGGEEAAEEALKSLKNCEGCINCSYCSDCSYCSRCSYCSYCSDCSYCSRCSYCSYCSRCSYCSYKKDSKPAEAVERLVVPKIENVHQKVFEAVSRPGALDMGSWHTCDTTHCRAGWVVTLAGEEGKKLEAFHDTALAAALIYHASSTLPVPMPRFYDKDKEAMADIKRLAELEKANE